MSHTDTIDTRNHADTDAEALVARYFAAWNETDADRRHALCTQAFAADATYLDPMMDGEGPAAIAAMIGGVQARFGAMRLRQVGRLDVHHDRLRFGWALGPAGGEPVAGGTDFATFDAAGLRSVTGFIDFLRA